MILFYCTTINKISILQKGTVLLEYIHSVAHTHMGRVTSMCMGQGKLPIYIWAAHTRGKIYMHGIEHRVKVTIGLGFYPVFLI